MLLIGIVFSRALPGLVALSVLASSLATGGAVHLCLTRAQVRGTCCCPQSAAQSDDDHTPAVRRSRCCEIRTAAIGHAPAVTEAVNRDGQWLVAVALATRVEGTPTWPRALADAQPARAPPLRSPSIPLFIDHCRYLI
ncbi:MAG TPA: hypothetical protein VFG83_07400 [Kofleriaceae bacterium]|nr:hypothetical protein [Kofleriaceae bacterium]